MNLQIKDRIYQMFAFTFVSVFALFCFIPFWLMISGSVSGERELLLQGYSLIPNHITFEAYQILFQSKMLLQSYKVTIFVAGVGTFLALSVSSMLAYSIANKKNRMRNIISFYVYFTMLFNGGMVPLFILVSNWLDLSNSSWALILPIAVQPFFVFLLFSFFRTIPEEIEEAGTIDGANEMTIFFRLIVPISKPILATVGLFYALIYWNDWFMALLFIDEDKRYPLQLMLRRLVSNMEAAKHLIPAGASYITNVPSLGIRMATTILTIGPIVLLYPYIQRYFVQGLTIGAVKG